jgi:hypothetical protein
MPGCVLVEPAPPCCVEYMIAAVWSGRWALRGVVWMAEERERARARGVGRGAAYAEYKLLRWSAQWSRHVCIES